MESRTVDGVEFPRDPQPRPRGMSERKAMSQILNNLRGCRRVIGQHNRGLYMVLLRCESQFVLRLRAVEETLPPESVIFESPERTPGDAYND